jgi:tetratricopeptide (TPR) repeat protein
MDRCMVVVGILCVVVSVPAAPVDNTAGIDTYIIQLRDELATGLNYWDPEAMLAARAGFESLLDRGGRDWLVHYYVALADYRIAIYYMQEKENETVGLYLDDAEGHLDQSIEGNPNFAESLGLLAAILGLKINENPISGIWIGPKVSGIIAEAKEVGPENPRVWLIDGMSSYRRPKMFGGGANVAKIALKKSISCFSTASSSDPAFPDWGADEAFAWLGIVEMQNDEADSARVHLERALAINPANRWVESVLVQRLDELTE